MERGPRARRCLGPDSAAMPRNDASDKRQPDSGARKVTRMMHSLERLEQPLGLRQVEPGAVVFYEEATFSPPQSGTPYLDPGDSALGAEFSCVLYQVCENLSY